MLLGRKFHILAFHRHQTHVELGFVLVGTKPHLPTNLCSNSQEKLTPSFVPWHLRFIFRGSSLLISGTHFCLQKNMPSVAGHVFQSATSLGHIARGRLNSRVRSVECSTNLEFETQARICDSASDSSLPSSGTHARSLIVRPMTPLASLLRRTDPHVGSSRSAGAIVRKRFGISLCWQHTSSSSELLWEFAIFES